MLYCYVWMVIRWRSGLGGFLRWRAQLKTKGLCIENEMKAPDACDVKSACRHWTVAICFVSSPPPTILYSTYWKIITKRILRVMVHFFFRLHKFIRKDVRQTCILNSWVIILFYIYPLRFLYRVGMYEKMGIAQQSVYRAWACTRWVRLSRFRISKRTSEKGGNHF